MANGRLNLTRDQLAAFLKDHQSIKQFEQLFKTVDAIGITGFDEVSLVAENANTRSQEALDALNRIANALELLALMPPSEIVFPEHTEFPAAPQQQDDAFLFPMLERAEVDNLTPPIQIGTLGQQQAERVAIRGGAIDGTTVGSTTPAAGSFTDLSVSNTGGNVLSSTWTPTLTKITNLDAVTAFICQYMRVGNVVTVSGRFDADATAAGAVELAMSLPVASNFTAQGNASGTLFEATLGATQAGVVLADSTNDRLSLRYVASLTTNRTFVFHATYVIL